MRFFYFVVIASRAQVKKLKCREEVKNMDNDNGHSFLDEVEDQLALVFLKIFVCVEQFSVGAVRIALDSYENIGKKEMVVQHHVFYQ